MQDLSPCLNRVRLQPQTNLKSTLPAHTGDSKKHGMALCAQKDSYRDSKEPGAMCTEEQLRGQQKNLVGSATSAPGLGSFHGWGPNPAGC